MGTVPPVSGVCHRQRKAERLRCTESCILKRSPVGKKSFLWTTLIRYGGNMKEQYKRLFNLAAILLLLGMQTAIFAVMWYQYFIKIESHFFQEFYQRGNWAVIGVYMLMMIFFTQMLGGYKVGYLRVMDTFVSHVIAILCCNVIEYFQLCIIFHDYINVFPVIFMALFEILIVIPWVFFTRRIYLKLYPAKHILYIYGERLQAELVEKINRREDKYSIEASVSIKKGFPFIYEKMKEYDAVMIGDMPSQPRNDILKYCYAEGKRAYVVPKVSDLILMGSTEINLFDTPLLLTRNYGLSAEQLFIKRVMDIGISLCGLVVLSPFMLITAIAIKLYDGGPVFYTQERLTRDRKPFKMIKFRSMIVDSEKNGARLAMRNDDRITPIGKITRRLHFDEIPQLINILKGDMAFVGPRPERDEVAKQYEEVIPEFELRLKVKAGLTGFAQVYGKYNTTPYDKLKLDLTYIERYSVLMDIRIILSTIKTLFQKDNTEGVTEKQITALVATTEEKE